MHNLVIPAALFEREAFQFLIFHRKSRLCLDDLPMLTYDQKERASLTDGVYTFVDSETTLLRSQCPQSSWSHNVKRDRTEDSSESLLGPGIGR